ncbi:Amino acid adenylation domain-containing protein [Sulfidibacter corallicola]|uniref:Amino acid adenylation domain-containing protein n=1 Tax=Sulfidibacter corallicola TaxID=2818388 RepID=A0A8A4TFG4_SULCO|nr:non-ribosomal peptide synthetase [Sulfidibacter corallicola]QTD48373.1 amino acid adenylation domain-containing protein [Sulfidibacter corallicola]
MIEGYNLSPLQREQWQYMIAGGKDGFWAKAVIQVDGPLDRARFRQVVAEVVSCHDMLTMRFHHSPSMIFPLQVPESPAIQWLDLPDPGANPSTSELLDRLATEPFDFEKDPPVRAAWLDLHQNRHVLLLAMPAVLADAATIDLLVGDLARAWAEANGGPENEFDPPHYLAFAEWLEQLHESEDADEGKAYWLKKDIGFQPPFVWEKPHEANARFRPKSVGIAPMAIPYNDVNQLAARLDTRVEAVCLAAWFVLLHRHLECTSLTVGVMTDGRSDEEMADMIGPLSRCLPVQLAFDRELGFPELVGAVAEHLEENQDWQDCFVNANFDFHSFAFEFSPESQAESAAGVSLRAAHKRVYDHRFALKLECRAQDGYLHPTFHFDQNRFHEIDVAVLQRRFSVLLADILKDHDRAVDAFSMLSKEEIYRLMVSFNDTHRDYPAEADLIQLFERQVRVRPEAPALECDLRVLSYAELNARANQLAHALRAHGVGPDVFVALFVERSLESVVGMLAILKAGGTYLPLDPEYPRDMLAYMLAETDARLVLTRSETASRLPDHDGEVLLLDADRPWAADDAARADLAPIHQPDHAAYVIFTSGSTGRPKGVLVPYRNLTHQSLTMRDFHELTERDRFLQFSSFNFDASLEQVFPPLIAGATVVLRGKESWGIVDIDSKIRDLGTTVVNFPTAFWHLVAKEWAQRDEPVALPNLRLAIAGGELMLSEHLQHWQRSACHAIPMVNAYGPTETTITATMYAVPEHYAETLPYHRVPIGRPLYNRRCYVLDDRLQPCAIGHSGMLYVAGAGIARGYLRRPALTAAVFVPDPFGVEPGARMYCTGDQARVLPDGNIQFLGRKDNQVKIRGFRIELGEIEHALCAYEGVDQGVVVAHRHQESDDTRLVAYYLPKADQVFSGQELREFLSAGLPDHMVPGHYVELQELPLKPNGKVDRQALPEPETAADAVHGGDQVAARTQEEEILAGIWCELLDLSSVGIHTNFFDLGGHSLLATRMVSKVRKLFGVDLTLKTIFAMPHIAGLAKHISTAVVQNQHDRAPAIEPAPPAANYPLSFSQRRVWFMYTTERNPAYHVPLPIRVYGKLNVAALERAIATVVARHDIFRTVYRTHDGVPHQVVRPAEDWRLAQLDLRDLDDATRQREVTELVGKNALEPFDLEEGPVLRARLVLLSEREFLLLFCIHHIASDGWSLGVLVQELKIAYEAFAQGQESPLPPLALQFTDFAVWQREWLQGEVLAREVDFWRNRLEDAPATTPLPYDREPGESGSHRGSLERFHLTPERQDALRRFCRREDITLFMLLTAAFKVVLHHMTGAGDILIGTDVANRNRDETENLIGFFINQLVLRTRFDGNPTLRDLLTATMRDTMEAYAHQDLPFDKLVEELNPPRGPHQPPFFNAKLVLQNAPETKLQVHGLVLVPEPSPGDVTKLDLQFNIQESDEGLLGDLHYKVDRFDQTTIERLLRLFDAVLAQAIAQPEQPLDELRAHLEETERARRDQAKRRHADLARSMFAKPSR